MLSFLDVVLDLARVLIVLLQLARVQYRLPEKEWKLRDLLIHNATHDLLVLLVNAFGLLLLRHIVQRLRRVLTLLFHLDRTLRAISCGKQVLTHLPLEMSISLSSRI